MGWKGAVRSIQADMRRAAREAERERKHDEKMQALAAEIFTLLPIEHILINANDDLLNKKTGHVEEQTILSVKLMRDSFEQLNLSRIDPPDSMSNFIHNMKFKKTTGFAIVEPLEFMEEKAA